jgi:serpin B
MRNINSICFMATLWVSLGFSMTALALEFISPDQAEAGKGNNAFAVALYGQLKDHPGNLFFSPASISTALAMTYAGARGETATEMANVLHFTLPQERLHPAMGGLLHEMNAAHEGYHLSLANALWMQKDLIVLDDFMNLEKASYNAAVYGVDFKGATEQTRQTINQWVEGQTANNIKDLIIPGAFNKDTRLVLTNAIYFKGDWQTQFKKEDTKNEDFHKSSTQTAKVTMMHRADGFNYYENIAFQALEIPYKSKELSMIVFLPKSRDGLATFEQSLTADDMQQWLGQLRPASNVIVTMPKFNMETQFMLNVSLQTMGVKQAFDRVKADFSGMVQRDEMLRDGNLYISAVIHKAFIDVNEEGTEAAAATGAGMGVSVCAGCGPPPPPVFRADHPFLFLIRDNKSGSILFMGRVARPQE